MVIWEYHTSKRQLIEERRSIGRILSTISMSLPSRLRIRPIGVLSKNDIGLRITRSSVSRKRCMDAFVVPFAKYNDVVNIATPIIMIVDDDHQPFGIGRRTEIDWLHYTILKNAESDVDSERANWRIMAMFIFINCLSSVWRNVQVPHCSHTWIEVHVIARKSVTR